MDLKQYVKYKADQICIAGKSVIDDFRIFDYEDYVKAVERIIFFYAVLELDVKSNNAMSLKQLFDRKINRKISNLDLVKKDSLCKSKLPRCYDRYIHGFKEEKSKESSKDRVVYGTISNFAAYLLSLSFNRENGGIEKILLIPNYMFSEVKIDNYTNFNTSVQSTISKALRNSIDIGMLEMFYKDYYESFDLGLIKKFYDYYFIDNQWGYNYFLEYQEIKEILESERYLQTLHRISEISHKGDVVKDYALISQICDSGLRNKVVEKYKTDIIFNKDQCYRIEIILTSLLLRYIKESIRETIKEDISQVAFNTDIKSIVDSDFDRLECGEFKHNLTNKAWRELIGEIGIAAYYTSYHYNSDDLSDLLGKANAINRAALAQTT